MKHLHTFESFLNESNEKDPNLTVGVDITIETDDQDGDFSAGDYQVVGLTRGGVIISGMGKTKLLVSFGALNDAGYTVNEGFQPLDYWKDYEVSTNIHQSDPKMSKKCTSQSEVLKCIDFTIMDWNDESEDGPISKSAEEQIGIVAFQFYKKFGYINGNIVSAMISQLA
jgi:hypothetical protein